MYHHSSVGSVSYGLVECREAALIHRGYSSVISSSRNRSSIDSGLEGVVGGRHVEPIISVGGRGDDLNSVRYNIGESMLSHVGVRYTSSFSSALYNLKQGSGVYHLGGNVSRHIQSGYGGDILVVYGGKEKDDVGFSSVIGVMQVEYSFDPAVFLKPRREGRFVGEAGAVQCFIEETFELMMGRAFPETIRVSVLGDFEFNALCSHPGTLGLAINRTEQGLMSDIFIRAGSLARVMLTLGHEIGHVLSVPLSTAVQEEAKAFAFSFAWMDVISQFDIGGLGDSFIKEDPAHNGLHDVACQFVWNEMQKGLSAREVYEQIVGCHIDFPMQVMCERVSVVN